MLRAQLPLGVLAFLQVWLSFCLLISQANATVAAVLGMITRVYSLPWLLLATGPRLSLLLSSHE